MSDYILGKTCEQTGIRDAVHMPIASVMAKGRLWRGERVKISGIAAGSPGQFASPAGVGEEADAIVDPFLCDPVEDGGIFFVLLKPGSTSKPMHVWKHPAFDAPSVLVHDGPEKEYEDEGDEETEQYEDEGDDWCRREDC